jgi:5-methyltetrahydrofolate--homocysteine methyltransferase
MSLIEGIRQAVITGQVPDAKAKVARALDDSVTADTLLHEGLIDAMREVGQRFEEGELFVPEMLLAARAMKGTLDLLKPHLVEQGVESLGTVAIGTVTGDLHDIGKSLVGMMLEGAGFELVDLGVDVSPEQFVAAVQDGANVVAMSALLTTTMPNMKLSIEAIEDAGLRDQVVVIVGGAPVTAAFAEEIGVDGYAADASSATRKTQELVGV